MDTVDDWPDIWMDEDDPDLPATTTAVNNALLPALQRLPARMRKIAWRHVVAPPQTSRPNCPWPPAPFG
ncbi:hypothetical protein [Yinghuangia seranimata]|uniref:hypothetical protein n=1 Tax=Yinghuangia seranimata TaxID=408067 RepID=UPI00248BEE18|nr:hypothetical protein [Yinghuangia seranimata]MDI2127624.1 hypothetical protein [Yinghuangia seranimata]